MSPFVGQELGKCKCSHLTQGGAKTCDGHSSDNRVRVFGQSNCKMPDSTYQNTGDEKPTTSEKISVCTSNHLVSLLWVANELLVVVLRKHPTDRNADNP